MAIVILTFRDTDDDAADVRIEFEPALPMLDGEVDTGNFTTAQLLSVKAMMAAQEAAD